MKISHEVPQCLLEESRNFNQYDYCLPHLMDENEEYKNFFLKSKELKREIYLDNSLHELSFPYKKDRLLYWLEQLQPSCFFVPDYWEDKTRSIVSAREWIPLQKHYPNITFIAVVQAKDIHEAAECYRIYKDLGYKKIAFSYGASYYKDLYNEEDDFNGDHRKMWGRIYVIKKLHEIGIINKTDRVHLLGCQLPQEFKHYDNIPFIESIDTSNPVMSTLDGVKYSEIGLFEKPKSNMNNNFNIKKEDINLELLNYNIKMFKKINGL